MTEEEKKRILHRRWLIAGVIALIIVIVLDLWYFVVAGLVFIVVLWVVARIIDYLSGADLDNHNDDYHPSNEEKTIWDIYTQDQILNHHDHNNDKY